jgi:hypothetical protein
MQILFQANSLITGALLEDRLAAATIEQQQHSTTTISIDDDRSLENIDEDLKSVTGQIDDDAEEYRRQYLSNNTGPVPY